MRRGATVALLLPVLAGCGGGGDDAPRAGSQDGPATAPAEARDAPAEQGRPSRREARRLAGGALVMSFEGPALPGYVAEALRRGDATGVILFGRNVEDAGQVRRLTAGIQRAAGGDALVMVDQEGGEIRNLPFAGPEAGQGSVTGPGEARRIARDAADDLRPLGVNVTLGPVADVATGAGSFVAGRAFPGGPQEVARLTAAAVRGYGEGRVAATVKHFPGLGAATDSTDDVAQDVDRPRAALLREELAPFRAAIAADVPLVMSAHARYPALDPRRIASQSRRILTGLLRDDLGFEGVVVTDSIEAAASTGTGPVDRVAERALLAGNDLVLTTGPGSHLPVLRRLERLARRSTAGAARLRQAAGRVAALRRRLGLRAGA